MNIGETWYQVIDYNTQPAKVFGFSIMDEFIIQHPDYQWKNKKISDYRSNLVDKLITVQLIGKVG